MQGWFVAHPGEGVFLSDEESALHAEHFTDRRQVAYVFDPISGDNGFFGWENGALVRYPDWEVWSVEHRPDAASPVTTPPKGTVLSNPIARWWVLFDRFIRRQPAFGLLIAGLLVGLVIGLLVAPDGGGSSSAGPVVGTTTVANAGFVERPVRFLAGGVPQASGPSGTQLTWDTSLSWGRAARRW